MEKCKLLLERLIRETVYFFIKLLNMNLLQVYRVYVTQCRKIVINRHIFNTFYLNYLIIINTRIIR